MQFSSTLLYSLLLVVKLVCSLPVFDTVNFSPSKGPQKSLLQIIEQDKQRQAQFFKERETSPKLASNPGLFDWIGLDQLPLKNKPRTVIPSIQDPNFHPAFSQSEQPAWTLESEAASAGKSSASSATAIAERAVNVIERVIPK